MAFTLPPTFYAALSLVPRIVSLPPDGPAPTVTVKKVFQFLHKTVTALQGVSAEAALHLWLTAAASASQCDAVSQGTFEHICFEFLTQALVCFEEEITETTRQYSAVFAMVGVLARITCLEAENFDAVSHKITQHAARLLKKPLQCRAVAACAHLFWCEARRDGKRVLECLQKCLKITDGVVQSDAKQVVLWVEMLDKYIYFYEVLCEEVTTNFISSLVNLCNEHIAYAMNEASSEGEGKKAKAHLKETLSYLRALKSHKVPEIAARFEGLELD